MYERKRVAFFTNFEKKSLFRRATFRDLKTIAYEGKVEHLFASPVDSLNNKTPMRKDDERYKKTRPTQKIRAASFFTESSVSVSINVAMLKGRPFSSVLPNLAKRWP